MGALSIVWTVALLAANPNGDVLGDAITALGFMIAFYYGFTGIACVVYFRRRILHSVKDFLWVGVAPLVGALMLFGIFGKAFHDYSKSGVNYSKPILGIQLPIFIGIGGLILGVILMLVAWPFHREFFSRRPEQPGPDGLALGTTIAPEDDVRSGDAAVPVVARGD
jgi:hypothetical protein